MSQLMFVLGANADPMRRELMAVQAMANQTGKSFQAGISGGSGTFGGATAMREILVLMREIGRGNWTRVPGSFTILLSQFGILNHLFKDNAAAARVAQKAVTESLINQAAASQQAAQAARELVARNMQAAGSMTRVTESELLAMRADELRAIAANESAAADRAKALAAIQASEAMEAEGAAASMSLGPIGWLAIGLVAVGASAFFLIRHYIHLEKEQKNLTDLMNTSKLTLSDQKRAMDELAESSRNFDNWLRKLSESQNTLRDATDDTIAAMREQEKLDEENARRKGKTDKQIWEMDIAAKKKELEYLKSQQALAQLDRITDEAAAKAAHDALTGRQDLSAGHISAVSEKAAEAAEIVDAIKEEMKKPINEISGYDVSSNPGTAVPIYKSRAANESDVMPGVKVGGKEYPEMSLAQATANFSKLQDEFKKLTDDKQKLADIESDAKDKTNADKAESDRLKKEIGRLEADLKVIESTPPDPKRKNIREHHTEMQQIGAYSSPVVDINRQQLKALLELVRQGRIRNGHGNTLDFNQNF